MKYDSRAQNAREGSGPPTPRSDSSAFDVGQAAQAGRLVGWAGQACWAWSGGSAGQAGCASWTISQVRCRSFSDTVGMQRGPPFPPYLSILLSVSLSLSFSLSLSLFLFVSLCISLSLVRLSPFRSAVFRHSFQSERASRSLLGRFISLAQIILCLLHEFM